MSGTGHAPRCDATAASGACADPAADPRYARQLAVPGVGPDGQRRLAAARVLCVGAGGLGSPAATYLAAAGVGTIGIIDDDVVELSNLHRQPLHATPDLGRSKADSASERLRALNPHTTVIAHPVRLEAGNALELVAGYDLVIDGADTFATRYIVSDATTLLGIPHVWAAVLGSGGQLSVFDARRGPVYRDLFPTIPAAGSVPSCAQAGVLGTVPGILGTALAAEALKLTLGWGEPLVGRVAVYDMRDGRWDELPLAANPQVRRPQSAAEVGAGLAASVTAARLREVLATAGQGAVVVDVREPAEAAAGAIPGSVNVPLARVLADPAAVLDLAAPGESASWEPAAGPRRPAAGDPKASAGANGALYVHCASGARSAMAVEALLAAARARPRAPRVFDVTGGFEAWTRTEPA
ncbi:ThiF family adenylyltransferase [Brevibacterium sp. BRM-1]|uniref:ThiF family adenylyltransferase n=1 Tax=Brevibacterium sp. BRM-1 TaxID=2999062 RepID=UPI0022828ED5|nr:ThiF family adenylyltransferase [Brevibacterium sp. BRM-1]WAL39720.1 ThiF family adenylyltransferase [Brevibacterium sp. BRM-1]